MAQHECPLLGDIVPRIPKLPAWQGRRAPPIGVKSEGALLLVGKTAKAEASTEGGSETWDAR